MNRLAVVIAVIAGCLFSTLSHAQTVTAKVIGATDGDAFTVLQHKQQFKVTAELN